jgi:hypothetical protein
MQARNSIMAQVSAAKASAKVAAGHSKNPDPAMKKGP